MPPSLPVYVAPPPICRAQPRSNAAEKKVFVFGLGYAGMRIAQQLNDIGCSVYGNTQTLVSASSAHKGPMITLSPEHIPHNQMKSFVEYHISNSTHVLSTVAPDTSSNEDLVLAQYSDLFLNSDSVKWLGYLSSTSVYGDYGGGWVHENSPILNPSAKGKLRLEVENRWLDLARRSGVPVCIFRAAGIYGPGRNALQTLLRNPNVMFQTSDTLDMTVSRIHVADLARAVTSAICLETGESVAESSKSFDQVYNISDDLPASRRLVFTYAEALMRELGLSRGNRKQTIETLSVRHKIRASKQVSNAKMKKYLMPNLSFPTYREGLDNIAQEMRKSK